MSAPWGVELDEDEGMFLDEGGVVGVVEDVDFRVGEGQEEKEQGERLVEHFVHDT